MRTEERQSRVKQEGNFSERSTDCMEVESFACDSLSPHEVEQVVQRQLLSDPDLQFYDLVVRRLPDGLCLEGCLDMDCDTAHVQELVHEVTGINNILNRLILLQKESAELE